MMTNQNPPSLPLFDRIKDLIDQSRRRVAVSINAELTMLYWQIGNSIRQDVLHQSRADYGKKIVDTIAAQLTLDYGKGWSACQLRTCLQFAAVFPDTSIVHTLCAQLMWSHFRQFFPVEDALKRDFYMQLTIVRRLVTIDLEKRMVHAKAAPCR